MVQNLVQVITASDIWFTSVLHFAGIGLISTSQNWICWLACIFPFIRLKGWTPINFHYMNRLAKKEGFICTEMDRPDPRMVFFKLSLFSGLRSVENWICCSWNINRAIPILKRQIMSHYYAQAIGVRPLRLTLRGSDFICNSPHLITLEKYIKRNLTSTFLQFWQISFINITNTFYVCEKYLSQFWQIQWGLLLRGSDFICSSPHLITLANIFQLLL